jgi:hypothetical protein
MDVVGRGRQGRRGAARAAIAAALALSLMMMAPGRSASARQEDDDDAKAASAWPNIYLDLNTVYSRVPPNTLALGAGNFATFSSAASQSVALNAPLTVDLTDRFSIFAGISEITSKSASSSWAPLTLDSWNLGFTAEVIKADAIGPTLTLQSTLTRPIRSNALGVAATTWETSLEVEYALDQDQMKGFIAGVRFTDVFVTSNGPLLNPTVAPTYVGYVGASYQWDSNWRLAGRFGLQSFGGADVGRLIHIPGFTQPIARIDLDLMDDNDNRLFGVVAQVMWTPSPQVQLTLRTPIYAVRN